MKGQATVNLLPSLDQRENGGWISSLWLRVLASGEDGNFYSCPQALPFPNGTNVEDGLQDLTCWWKVSPFPVLKPQA